MNARRHDISQCLEKDLLPRVREAFGKNSTMDKARFRKELDQVLKRVKAAELDPEQ